jgi:hypothetical protein
LQVLGILNGLTTVAVVRHDEHEWCLECHSIDSGEQLFARIQVIVPFLTADAEPVRVASVQPQAGHGSSTGTCGSPVYLGTMGDTGGLQRQAGPSRTSGPLPPRMPGKQEQAVGHSAVRLDGEKEPFQSRNEYPHVPIRRSALMSMIPPQTSLPPSWVVLRPVYRLPANSIAGPRVPEGPVCS